MVCTSLDSIDDDFVCTGCLEGDYFKKAVHLPEIVEKLCEIENEGKLNRKNIRFLDSIILRFSLDLIDLCRKNKNIDEINRYYFKKCIERLVKEIRDKYRDNQQVQKIKSKQIIEVLFHLCFKELKEPEHITV